MKRLYLTLFAVTLSVVTILAAALPVAADSGDNKPIAWVDSEVNTNGRHLKDPIPFHVAHSLHVKMLADGSIVGNIVAHDFVTKTETRFMDADFDQEQTRFFDGYEGTPIIYGIGPIPDAKVAMVVVHAGEPGMMQFHMAYFIVDCGEPSNLDWHRILLWGPEWGPYPPIWFTLPEWNFSIPYKGDGDKPMYGGNANVVMTEAYDVP